MTSPPPGGVEFGPPQYLAGLLNCETIFEMGPEVSHHVRELAEGIERLRATRQLTYNGKAVKQEIRLWIPPYPVLWHWDPERGERTTKQGLAFQVNQLPGLPGGDKES